MSISKQLTALVIKKSGCDRWQLKWSINTPLDEKVVTLLVFLIDYNATEMI